MDPKHGTKTANVTEKVICLPSYGQMDIKNGGKTENDTIHKLKNRLSHSPL